MLPLKQTSVYFEKHFQNFTCCCSKRRIHRFLGQVSLARGYKNIHYLCNICIHLVILSWKWFKKKNARTTIQCKKYYWQKIKRTSSTTTTTTITVVPSLRTTFRDTPCNFSEEEIHELTHWLVTQIFAFGKETTKKLTGRVENDELFNQWIHWGIEKVLGEKKKKKCLIFFNNLVIFFFQRRCFYELLSLFSVSIWVSFHALICLFHISSGKYWFCFSVLRKNKNMGCACSKKKVKS